MYQVAKPNGEKLAWLDKEEALEKAVSLSKQVGDHPVIYYELECEDDEGDTPGKEWVVDTQQFVKGEMVSQSKERYENQPYVPAPGTSKKKKGKAAKTPEEQAAIDAEKAEKKAKKDAEKALRAEQKAKNKEEREKARAERAAQREKDKANRPSGPRSRLPDDGLINILRTTNPKRPGTACYPRFDLYQEGMTVKAYKEANPDFGSADLAWDIDHGFIKVTKADGSDLDPVTPPTPALDGDTPPSVEPQPEQPQPSA